ncbi:MAG TPA: potassium-transporting ATPase subunit C [Acidimicrobiales bacterium]|nr:potassium-transporting ATPase subunit C [Acidimicrobiales bacterium]
MLVHLRRAVVVSIVFFVLLGLAYPLLITGVGQAFFNRQANGDLVSSRHGYVGSSLIGQHWPGPRWFQGRPDADNPMATGPQNYGPKSKLLLDFARAQVRRLEKEGIRPTNELVTGSGSGVDPDISPRSAYAQVDAVARANHLPVAAVRHLVATHVIGPYWGFLGSPYVNVFRLNQSLAHLESGATGASRG